MAGDNIMAGGKITELWAWVIDDDGMGDGDEGVPGIKLGPGMVGPAMGSNTETAKKLRAHMETVAKDLGRRIELRRFTNMEVLDVVDYRPKKD
jgi:hypothetical protein